LGKLRNFTTVAKELGGETKKFWTIESFINTVELKGKKLQNMG
jgi:hypothetical protein